MFIRIDAPESGRLPLSGRGAVLEVSAISPTQVATDRSTTRVPGGSSCVRSEQCPKGYTCVDDPKDSCDLNTGGADRAGVCMAQPTTKMCDGFANLPCADGCSCVDNPNDDRDPNHGGADCGGICVNKP